MIVKRSMTPASASCDSIIARSFGVATGVMKRKPLGNTGETIPEIGLGTWRYAGGSDPLRAGIALGADLIDTAERYGTEGAVGEAIMGIRDKVFVATKVRHENLRYDDVLRAADNSLKEIGIDYIDLYQIHRPNAEVQIAETMRALDELVDAGKVRHLGVSNFSVAQMEEAQAESKNRIVSNQVLLVFGGPYAAFLLWLFTNHDAARPTSWGRAPRTLGFLYLSLLISLALVGSIMKSAPVQKGRLVDSQVKLDHIYSKALWDDSNNWSNLRSLEPLDRPGGAWYQFSLPQNDVEVSGFIPRRSGTIYLDDSQILFLLEYAMHKVPRAEKYFYQEALEEQQMLNDMLRKTFLKKSLIVSLPLFLSTMIILRQGERKGGRS